MLLQAHFIRLYLVFKNFAEEHKRKENGGVKEFVKENIK